MKRIQFTEKQPEYRYFPVADNYADVFIYSFVEETVEKYNREMGDISNEVTVYTYDVNEFHVPQSEVTENMVKADPMKYLDYTVPVEETTEGLMFEVLADHEERICLMELGIEEGV